MRRAVKKTGQRCGIWENQGLTGKSCMETTRSSPECDLFKVLMASAVQNAQRADEKPPVQMNADAEATL